MDQMEKGSVKVKLYVNAVLFLCALVVVSVLGLTLIRPSENNLALIGSILGIFTPIVTALIAGAMQENHKAMNSRLTQLLELTAKSSKAEGKLEGPNT